MKVDLEHLAVAAPVAPEVEQYALLLFAGLGERSGNVLTLEFENRTKIIVNLQPPMSEIWIAAKAGGFHFRFIDGEWRDTRSGTEFFAALSEYATQQAGEPVQFKA